MIAFDGREYTHEIPLPLILDTLLAAGRVPRCVAVMIDDSTWSARLDELGNRAWFAELVAEDLVPWVRAHWRVTRDPHRVIITGSSAGGLAAAYIALNHPDLFGNVLSQSGAFWFGPDGSNGPPWNWVARDLRAKPRRDVRFGLEVGLMESRGGVGGERALDADVQPRAAQRARGEALSRHLRRGRGGRAWTRDLGTAATRRARRTLRSSSPALSRGSVREAWGIACKEAGCPGKLVRDLRCMAMESFVRSARTLVRALPRP